MKKRAGFSLLEVILALALLGGAIAVLGEAGRQALRNAQVARDLSHAELLCESKLSEILAGITPATAVGNTAFDSATTASIDPGEPAWLYSIETGATDENGSDLRAGHRHPGFAGQPASRQVFAGPLDARSQCRDLVQQFQHGEHGVRRQFQRKFQRSEKSVTGTSGQYWSFYPEGILQDSPGLPRSGYPGGRGCRNILPRRGCGKAAPLRNPFRVEKMIGPATQGSRCAATLGYLMKALRANRRIHASLS